MAGRQGATVCRGPRRDTSRRRTRAAHLRYIATQWGRWSVSSGLVRVFFKKNTYVSSDTAITAVM